MNKKNLQKQINSEYRRNHRQASRAIKDIFDEHAFEFAFPQTQSCPNGISVFISDLFIRASIIEPLKEPQEPPIAN